MNETFLEKSLTERGVCTKVTCAAVGESVAVSGEKRAEKALPLGFRRNPKKAPRQKSDGDDSALLHAPARRRAASRVVALAACIGAAAALVAVVIAGLALYPQATEIGRAHV